MPTISWRTIILTLSIVAGSLFFEFCSYAICDGSYELSVTIQSTSKSPIARVNTQVFRQTEDARYCLAHPENRDQPAPVSTVPFVGAPVLVRVPHSFRRSPLGRVWGRSQCKGLLVMATYSDGRRVRQVVDIPDEQMSRIVAIDVP